MIEIQCPRCKQYWYSDEDEGRVRLCSRCVDDLRRQRGPRAEIDIPFLIAVALCLVFAVMMIVLTALFPKVFGGVMLGIGSILCLMGLIFLRVLTRRSAGLGAWVSGEEFDWSLGRWAMLILLTGLACVLAFASFVGIRR
jgi:hypothetical protein